MKGIIIMSYPVNTRRGIHYLGNNNPNRDHEVHDLYNEQPQCQISEILKHNHAVAFSPDTLEQANKEGFDNDAYCIGSSTR